jgi:putative salt-induced outer membrane protein
MQRLKPFVLPFALAAAQGAHAQVTMKPDGQWRALFTAGATVTGGNTKSNSVSLSGDVVRLRDFDKWAFNANGQYASSEGTRTADRQSGQGLYTRDITPRWFGFGQLDLLHDPLAAIKSRATLGAGVGYHVIKETDNTWDVSGGFGYTWDRYEYPQVVDGDTRIRYNHAEALLSEESNHKLSENTSFKQKLTVYPDLHDSGDVRTVFDTGLSVAMTKRLALTATFEHRYDSRPGEGVGKTDTQLVTGVSLRLD